MTSERSLPVRFTPAAAGDLDAAFAYIGARNRPAAAVLLQRLQDAVTRLADFPEMGAELPPDEFELLRPGARVIIVEPYAVFYRVTRSAVVVLRVLHTRRDHLGELLESLGE